jgi:DNA-binding CsgD family transcriptional regulator
MVTRCRALITLSAGYDEQACQSLAAAADAFGGIGLQFDRARTLFVAGRVQRRYRKWGGARESLTEAAAAFTALGCHGWAERVDSELSRLGGRRPAREGHLTAAEERVVRLAAAGLSNKEIAAELVVAVHTVEVHLSRAYAKLQVRSRSQLIGALSELDLDAGGSLAPR